jgi:hypothetical protein
MRIDSALGREVAPAPSLTVTLKLKGLPTAVVGVPEMTPLVGSRLRPGGGVPEVTIQLLYGGVPVVAASVWEYGTPTVPPGSEEVVMLGAAVMLIDSALDMEVAPALSPTFTLKLNGLPVAAVGVPLITPELAFTVRPGGSVPLETAQLLYGGTPPVAASVCE